MSDVKIEINGRSYQVSCEDGQEDRLRLLAALLQKRLQDVVSTVGQVGQDRLLLMASLLMADELSEALAEIDTARANTGPNVIKQLQDEAEAKAITKSAHIFELLAERIESIAERIEAS